MAQPTHVSLEALTYYHNNMTNWVVNLLDSTNSPSFVLKKELITFFTNGKQPTSWNGEVWSAVTHPIADMTQANGPYLLVTVVETTAQGVSKEIYHIIPFNSIASSGGGIISGTVVSDLPPQGQIGQLYLVAPKLYYWDNGYKEITGTGDSGIQANWSTF